MSFPETSNQQGWDLLVNGQPFQVKCGQDKQIVERHFEKYPDIPVIAFERIVQVLGKAGIHAYTLRKELLEVEQAMVAYSKKI